MTRKRRIVPALLGGGEIVAYPSGWTLDTLPFSIRRGPVGGFQVVGFDLQEHAGITATKTYYVDRSMSDDLGDGLTWGTAFQKVTTALGQADVDRIYIAAGVYEIGYGWEANTPTRSIEVIGVGDVRLSAHRKGLSWSLDTTHYEASQATKIWNVFDASIPDANGDYSELTLAADEAAVEATAGSWYWDDPTDTLFVRTADDREPDADILPIETSTYCGLLTAAQTVYLENLNFEGGATSFGLASSSASAKVYAKNCTFKYSYNVNGFLGSGGGEVILQNCTAAANGGPTTTATDGFKFVENTGQYSNVVLINCTSRGNGRATNTSSNGYSRHDRGNTVIINGSYYGNYGPNIFDIDTGNGDPMVWCLGVYAHDSESATETNFSIGTEANQGGEMWLDTCKSENSTNDLAAGTGAIMNYHNINPASPVTTGAGTFTAY